MYELCCSLIKRGKAYVCHQTKKEIEACRAICKGRLSGHLMLGDPESPWRNRPEESLSFYSRK